MPGPSSELTRLLLEWQEQRRLGKPATPEKLCDNAPELVEALQQQIDAIEVLQRQVGMTMTFNGENLPASDAITVTHQPNALPDFATIEYSPQQHETAERHIASVDSSVLAVPGYEILQELGRGGMGVVYKARQIKANRVVALKMILGGGIASPAEIARFRTEAEAIAGINHAHIVQIYDVGEHAGLPYFSLEYCPRGTLKDKLRGDPISAREASALVEKIAHGIAAAHAKGIIHRDLKPANILLASPGSESGESLIPKIADFGLAKRFDDDSGQTKTGAIMGTPSYMSPEQASGEVKTLGPACDVYALGAILYECLTGRPPFKGATTLETLEQVRRQDPVSPRLLQPAIARDLNTICLNCLEKRPEKRYSSAMALAEDLRRFLDHRPIQARPVGEVEKLVRWCWRNPLLTASMTGIVGIFLAAFVLVTWSYVRSEDARKDEATQRQVAEEARNEAQEKEKAERWGRYRSNIAAASAALQLQNSGAARGALDDAPKEHRNWEWHYLHSQLDGASLVLPVPGGKYRSHVLSPSGQQVAVCAADQNEVYLYDVATGKLDAVLRGHSAPATSVTYRPDGKQVATASNDQTIRLWEPGTGQQTALLKTKVTPPNLDCDPIVTYNLDGSRIVSYPMRGGAGTSRLWDAGTGQEIAVLREWQEFGLSAAFSRDGKRVAVGSGENVYLCDAVTGRRLAVPGTHAKWVDLAYSPDGKRMASAAFEDASNAIHLWDGESGKEVAVLRGHTAFVSTLLFSPDGSRLVSGSQYADNTARLWDAATGRPLTVLAGHKNEIIALAFSPDGKRVATASRDQTARLWHGSTGQLLAVLGGHTGTVVHVLFSPDGTRVVTASEDATLRLWHAQTGELIGVLRGHGDGLNPHRPPVYTPDGSRLVSGSTDGTVRIWDMSLAERNGILQGHKSYVYDVAFSPNGEQVASAAWDGTSRLWDPTTGRQTGLLKHETKIISSVAYSRDGCRLATLERDRGVTLWDVASQKAARDWRVPAGDFNGDSRASLSPAGTLLAAGCAEGPVRLWDVATGWEVARLEGHDKHSIDVTFHPDGSLLATTGFDGTVRLWDVATRAPVAVLRGPTDYVWRVAFSTDGKLLAAGSNDKTIRLWDAQTHEFLESIPVASIVYSVAFSPDGKRLAAGCRDHTVRLYDVASRQQVAELRGHTDYVHAVAWSPDGTRLVSGSGDHTVRVWDALSAHERVKRAADKPPPRER